jgi:hypothetical protein
MTEAKWLRLKKSWPMLKYLRGKVSDRKCWLFVANFWRNATRIFSETTCRLVANAGEHIAGEPVPPANHRAVFNAIQRDHARFVTEQAFFEPSCLREFRDLLFADLIEGWVRTDWGETAFLRAMPLEAAHRGFLAARWVTYFDSQSLSETLRDIIGNPFRPITLNPAWLRWHDGLLVSMAQKMYDTRDFSDMPVLADALEEAGCDNPDILNHCRSGGEHVRGCWVLDLLLGKS